MKNWRNYQHNYIGLAKDSSLKLLEKPFVFKCSTDELYEVNEEAVGFLKKCDGRTKLSDLQGEEEFLEYIIEENIVEFSPRPFPQEIKVGASSLQPSLRYLMVEVTLGCNLNCLHCYQGNPGSKELSWVSLEKILQDFENMGGLRLIVTGGEPLLYSHFDKLNKHIRGKKYRKILVTNGTLINSKLIKSLNFDEVQVSLDGLEKAHDILRGKGTFKKAMAGIKSLSEENYPFSIATVLHRDNLSELSNLASLVKELGAVSWTIDFPVMGGNLAGNSELLPYANEAVKYLDLSYGAEVHCSEGAYACGSHLGCVKASGAFTKCGFYNNDSGAIIEEGLASCWERLYKFKLEDLNCRCAFLSDCRGGCRYRAEVAGDRWGPDPVKCIQFGVKKEESILRRWK